MEWGVWFIQFEYIIPLKVETKFSSNSDVYMFDNVHEKLERLTVEWNASSFNKQRIYEAYFLMLWYT